MLVRALTSLNSDAVGGYTLQASSFERGVQCTGDVDCWLNGDCIDGVCVCDAAWTGSACNVLVELPSTQLWPPLVLPSNESELASSWGASIVQDDDGLWHGFFDVVCGEYTWMHIEGAVIVHATAPHVYGPYSFSDVALPQQSMTPHVVRDLDGSWLLLHERNTSVVGIPQCTGNYSASTDVSAVDEHDSYQAAAFRASLDRGRLKDRKQQLRGGYNGPPSVARSKSLYGPWTFTDFNVTLDPAWILPNPNPSILPPPNTSSTEPYFLAFTTMPANYTTWGTERIAIASASKWSEGVFTPLTGAGAPPAASSPGEDPFLWRSKRGYHVVYHAMDAAANMSFTGVGGYAISVDGHNWTFSPTPIYTSSVPWADSRGAPVQFTRRERPEFLFDNATGEITHLLTGCELYVNKVGHSSLSVLTPVRRGGGPLHMRVYNVSVVSKAAEPVISIGKSVGQGHSPCNLTFNPAFLPAHPPGLNQSILIMRASGCTPEYGGASDHLLFAYCNETAGTCGDVQPLQFSPPFEYLAEDPRAWYNPVDSRYYMYYFANGTNQSTVFLRRTATPLNVSSWELVASNLPWHRNGCVIQHPNGTNYVIYGETYGRSWPGRYLQGIGIATTTDWATYNVIDDRWMEPIAAGPEPEVCLEASTHPVQLSTGDYLHFYAAGTLGWGPWGPGIGGSYVGGFVILDKDDPTKIMQRSAVHPMVPSMDYEIGNSSAWPVYRNNTLFMTSLVPIPNQTDTFRCWYGAADANVATAIIRVTYHEV